nr:MAG TPA: hypothetical protein [Caudoviricetes sp.]
MKYKEIASLLFALKGWFSSKSPRRTGFLSLPPPVRCSPNMPTRGSGAGKRQWRRLT